MQSYGMLQTLWRISKEQHLYWSSVLCFVPAACDLTSHPQLIACCVTTPLVVQSLTQWVNVYPWSLFADIVSPTANELLLLKSGLLGYWLCLPTPEMMLNSHGRQKVIVNPFTPLPLCIESLLITLWNQQHSISKWPSEWRSKCRQHLNFDL